MGGKCEGKEGNIAKKRKGGNVKGEGKSGGNCEEVDLSKGVPMRH